MGPCCGTPLAGGIGSPSPWPPVALMAWTATSMRGPGVRAGLVGVGRATATCVAAAVDGVAQPEAEVVAGADVAHGGEARLEGLLRVHAGVKGLLRRLAHDALEEVEVEVLARLEGEVDVGVDEAGQQRDVAEVDDLRAGGDGDVDAGNAVAGDDDGGVGDDVVGGAVEETGGFEGDGSGLLLGERRG